MWLPALFLLPSIVSRSSQVQQRSRARFWQLTMAPCPHLVSPNRLVLRKHCRRYSQAITPLTSLGSVHCRLLHRSGTRGGVKLKWSSASNSLESSGQLTVITQLLPRWRLFRGVTWQLKSNLSHSSFSPSPILHLSERLMWHLTYFSYAVKIHILDSFNAHLMRERILHTF